jgi:hypothetical protein|tara:strand:+ start:227 stop:592 length:366 start_codon:yes stop_codon:yes gene_type:complete
VKLRYILPISAVITFAVFKTNSIVLDSIKLINKYYMECKTKYTQDVTIHHYKRNPRGLVLTATRLGANKPFVYFFENRFTHIDNGLNEGGFKEGLPEDGKIERKKKGLVEICNELPSGILL